MHLSNADKITIKQQYLLQLMLTPEGDLTLFAIKDRAEKQKVMAKEYRKKLEKDSFLIKSHLLRNRVLHNREIWKKNINKSPILLKDLDTRPEVEALDKNAIQLKAEYERMHFVDQYFDGISKLPDNSKGFIQDF